LDNLLNDNSIEELNNPDRVPDRVPDTYAKNITENQNEILRLLAIQSKMSMSQLAETIGISKRKILNNINKLRDLGMLERIGDNKTGHWKVNNTN